MYTFNYENCLFRIDSQEGLVAYYEDERETTTIFNLYVHDTHATVSEAVERSGLWVPVITLHWKEIRDEQDGEFLGPDDVDFSNVEEFVRDGHYEDLLSATTEI